MSKRTRVWPRARMARRLLTLFSLTFGVVAGVFWSLPAFGQGTGPYVNFETPVHDGILVSTIGAGEYLLVVNSEDNAVEVYDTASLAFVTRIPVGLEPVTVVRKPTPVGNGVRFYAANWLGDSITAFVLEETGATPTLRWRVERTVPTADEPIGITILPEVPSVPNTLPGSIFHEALIVTNASQGTYALLDDTTLLPFAGGWGQLELFDTTGGLGIKEPRAVEFAPVASLGGQTGVIPPMAVLNLRGGNSGSIYDFDLWVTNDLAQSIGSGQAVGPTVGDLGTTNFNMDFGSRGTLYVVGQEARNDEIAKDDIDGEQKHRDMETNETGFARSALWRVRQVGTNANTAELDLNRGLAGISDQPTCTLPTDLEIHENAPPEPIIAQDPVPVGDTHVSAKMDIQPVPVSRTRIFVACMGSDTVGVVVPNPNNFGSSRIVRVDTNPGGFSATNLGGQMRGPRALAFKDSSPRRLYVLNRVSHSVTVINADFNLATPGSAVLQTFDLQGRVAPQRVVDGRKVFYSSKLSGFGKSSCATCHIDGDSDQLAWNLSAPGVITPQTVLPGALLQIDPETGELIDMSNHKGPMVTQTLRGLLNYEIFDNQVADFLFSNQPYHWRGDKGFFTDFNAAFFNLMAFCAPGVTCIDPGGNGAKNKGLPDATMIAYRDFINTVTQEPNPEQPKDRTYSGSEWADPENPPTPGSFQERLELNDIYAGSGAVRGLKIYHMLPTGLGENCVQCHALPEGSDNDLTEALQNQEFPTVPRTQLETAALRDMIRKEKFLFRRSGDPLNPLINTGVRTAEFGLIHSGEDHILPFGSGSVFDFVTGFENPAFQPAETTDVTLYVREFDSGVAPGIGLSLTVEQPVYSDPANQPAIDGFIDLLEAQANAANIGIAVHLRTGNLTRGFWFDVTENSTAAYKEEKHSGLPNLIGPLTRTRLLAFVDVLGNPDDHVTFFATPLGSDRRVAFLDSGDPGPLSGTVTASNLQLEPMRPNTANVLIPRLELSWAVLNGTNKKVIKQTRLLQRALWQFADDPMTYDVGLDLLHHEASRRFRVRGDGIKPGAWIGLATPAPDPNNPNQPSCNAFDPQSLIIAVPIYPARDENGALVWETAAEIDSRLMYALMSGWLAAPGVSGVLTDPDQYDEANPPNPNFPTNPQEFYLPGTFDPVTWGQHVVLVANDLGTIQQTVAIGGCQRLTLE